MTELSLGERKSASLRYVSTILFVGILIVSIVMNGLAGPGAGPFENSTGDVSDAFPTCITPAGYTFSIWGVIYFLLTAIAIYSIVILFRKIGFNRSWELGGAVSVPFLLVMCVNLSLNIGWLFAWDAKNMVAAFVLLLIIAITNGLAVGLSLHSFSKAARTLFTNSKFDFWMGCVVLNGVAMYAFWTVIASLINLSIVIIDSSNTSDPNVSIEDVMDNTCISVLSFLLVAVIIHFIIEQTILKRVANPVFTHYMVYLWASVGVYMKNKDSASDTVVNLIIANISMAAFFLFLRFVFIFFRNRKNQMYKAI